MNKSYSELQKLKTFKDRYEYLKIGGAIGQETFGHMRYLNQRFYKSEEWRELRPHIITRDNACDLGVEDYDVVGHIILHHINPITIQDIIDRNPMVLDPENLICVSDRTHRAIHYGTSFEMLFEPTLVIRRPNDTCPWKR